MDFLPIDVTSPLDTDVRLKAMPENWPIKGLFFCAAINALKKQNIQTDLIKEYQVLTPYDCHDLLILLDKCSSLLWPELSPRATLRKLGADVVPVAMKKIPLGAMFFRLSQNNVLTAFKMVQRVYNILSPTKAVVIEYGQNYAITRLTNAWVFPTCYHVGTFEGTIRSMGYENIVATVHEESLSDILIKCVW